MGLDQYLYAIPKDAQEVYRDLTPEEVKEIYCGTYELKQSPSGEREVWSIPVNSFSKEEPTQILEEDEVKDIATEFIGYEDPYGEIHQQLELHYWRKHPSLHGFMERLWFERNPNSTQEFNCVPVKLTREDCQEVIKAVLENKLPYTTGFCFGVSDESQDSETIEAMLEAIQVIDQGFDVFYESWW